MRPWHLVVLPALLIAAGGPPVHAQAPGPPLSTARARVASGDRDGAREILDRLLAADSLGSEGRTEALYLRARVEEDGVRYAALLEELLGRGLRQDRQAGLHLSLGQIAFLRNDFALALQEFSRAREKGREEEGSLWEGLAAFGLGDLEGARAALTRAQSSGNSGLRQRAWMGLGDVLRTGERWGEARDAYRKVREEGPEGGAWWGTAVLRESECLDRLGDASQAEALCAELLAERPNGYEAPLARARLDASREGSVPPIAAASGPGSGFTVQVGAFADPDNADALRRVLDTRGVAGVRVVRGEDGLSRVLVGTGLDRPRAESLGDSLGAELGVGFSLVPETPQ